MKSVTVKGFFVMHCLSIIWILVFVFFAVTPNIEAQATPAATNDYELQLLLKVPMRDGIRLNATIYRPVHATSPLPVIFSLSPYPMLARDGGGDLASHGYIYAFVQSRGRGDSEGSFDPMAQESHDGYDVVEWFAKQPWCNGKVGMAGGSYAGGDQWITAATRPPHLTTIIPAASAHPGIDFPWLGNIADNYALQWLAFVAAGKSPNEQVYEDEALWSSAITRFFLKKAAFNTLDSFEGNPSAIFQKWLTHPDKDDYWIEMGAQLESVAAIDIPVLEITGQQDGDQAGALDYHDQFVSKLSASGAPKQDYLIIGPWEHSGTRVPRQDVDGEHYGSASLLNMERLHREWYDYTMKGNPRPAFLRKPVAYYVVGKNAECWKYADSLEAVSTSSLKLYLDPTGGASSVYHSGMLLPSQNGAAGGQWTSDPNDLSASSKPEVIVGESSTGPAGESLHGNGLIFHSAPFTKETELDGKMDLQLSLQMDVPDTDLEAALLLVTPDGKAHKLAHAVLRGRYRNSLSRPEPIPLNQPQLYHFTSAIPNWFAVRAPKGSQLRLIVQSLNLPDLEKNYNSMKPVALQTGLDARIGHILLLQTPDHPSELIVPLGDPNAECKASAQW